jgi:hypothetical protein
MLFTLQRQLVVIVLVEGPTCRKISCSSSFSWFGNVDSDHSPIVASDGECGGVGNCDYDTGVCTYARLFLKANHCSFLFYFPILFCFVFLFRDCGASWDLFYGDRCQYMTCPVGQDGSPCRYASFMMSRIIPMTNLY